MPKRKRYGAAATRKRTKRSNIRRRRRVRATSWKIARPMRPRVYNFTRSYVETIQLVNNPSGPVPSGWSVTDDAGMVKAQAFNLAQLPDYSEFTSLYAQYRILAVKTTMYFSSTNSNAGDDSLANRQILLYMAPNRNGVSNTVKPLTESHFLQTQATKKKLCLNTNGRPISVYMKLNQLNEVFSGTVNTDYTAVRPKFLSTTETATPHYGLDFRFQRVDNAGFSAGGAAYPSCKMIHKVYLQCRQVE